MRNIWFHGLTFEGAWVHGYYVCDRSKPAGRVHCIAYICDDGRVIIDSVYPESIGMSTGFLDKDGKHIYENDVCEARYNEFDPNDITISAIRFVDGAFRVYELHGNVWAKESNILDANFAHKNKVITILQKFTG